MKDLEIKIDQEGNFSSIHDDTLNDLYSSLGKISIQRCSHVEWEEGGWTVRSHKNPEKALRVAQGCVIVSTESKIPLAHFESREAGISAELKNFWALL